MHLLGENEFLVGGSECLSGICGLGANIPSNATYGELYDAYGSIINEFGSFVVPPDQGASYAAIQSNIQSFFRQYLVLASTKKTTPAPTAAIAALKKIEGDVAALKARISRSAPSTAATATAVSSSPARAEDSPYFVGPPAPKNLPAPSAPAQQYAVAEDSPDFVGPPAPASLARASKSSWKPWLIGGVVVAGAIAIGLAVSSGRE